MDRIPILRVGDMLLVSVQTDMHDELALRLQDDLLHRIEETSCRGVLIDIAGLDVVDSFAGRLLGDLGEAEKLTVKFDVTANRVTDSARKHIEAAGGSVKETGTRRDVVRGVDRNSDDRSPKNLTKKLRRTSAGMKKK